MERDKSKIGVWGRGPPGPWAVGRRAAGFGSRRDGSPGGVSAMALLRYLADLGFVASQIGQIADIGPRSAGDGGPGRVGLGLPAPVVGATLIQIPSSVGSSLFSTGGRLWIKPPRGPPMLAGVDPTAWALAGVERAARCPAVPGSGAWPAAPAGRGRAWVVAVCPGVAAFAWRCREVAGRAGVGGVAGGAGRQGQGLGGCGLPGVAGVRVALPRGARPCRGRGRGRRRRRQGQGSGGCGLPGVAAFAWRCRKVGAASGRRGGGFDDGPLFDRSRGWVAAGLDSGGARCGDPTPRKAFGPAWRPQRRSWLYLVPSRANR